MFLDIWMIVAIAALFGFCALWNHRKGFHDGAKDVLQSLYDSKVIMIVDGEVVPYRNAWGQPQKRRRTKKAVDISN